VLIKSLNFLLCPNFNVVGYIELYSKNIC